MKTIKQYFRKRRSAILKLVNTPAGEYTAGKFHKLRVEIKRIHALAGMLAFCTGDYDQRREFRPFRKLTRKAGRVREVQLQKMMTREYGEKKLVRGYRRILDEDEDEARKDFRSVLNNGHAGKIDSHLKNMRSAINRLEMGCIEIYIAEKERKVVALNRKLTMEAGEVHELRRELKDLGYLKESLGPTSDTDLEQLTALIGEWHDCDVFLQQLREDERIQALDREETEAIRRMEKKVSIKAGELLNKIREEVKLVNRLTG